MRLGAFARIWQRDSAAEIAAAMAHQGLTVAQWNFSALGQPTVTADRRPEDLRRVREAFDAVGIEAWGLSASFNLIEPDLEARAELVRGVCHMIGIASELGATAVTLLTGSRSADGYSFDPRNREKQSWTEMLRSLEPILDAASGTGMLVGIEPEGGNVVIDAEHGLALFEEFGDDAPIGFIIDPWNLVEGDLNPGARHRSADTVVNEAFDLLGPRAICLQAKDPLEQQSSSFGLDYGQVGRLHRAHTPDIPVVIQDVDEASMPRAISFLRSAWA